MGAQVRNEPALIFTTVGVHADVEIKVRLAAEDAESAYLDFGRNEELTIDFADVDSLQRLAAAAEEGARLLRERIEENRAADARGSGGEADRLAGTR